MTIHSDNDVPTRAASVASTWGRLALAGGTSLAIACAQPLDVGDPAVAGGSGGGTGVSSGSVGGDPSSTGASTGAGGANFGGFGGSGGAATCHPDVATELLA